MTPPQFYRTIDCNGNQVILDFSKAPVVQYDQPGKTLRILGVTLSGAWALETWDAYKEYLTNL